VVNLLEARLVRSQKESPYIPIFVMKVFGLTRSNPDNVFPEIPIPQKLVISDSYDVLIEINFVIRKNKEGGILEHCYFPPELNRLFGLFMPKEGLAILLAHDPLDDVEACIAAFRSCEGGENLEFPAYLDVVSLWVYLGGYTVYHQFKFMYRMITGGTILNESRQSAPEYYMADFLNLADWTQAHIVAHCRAIVMLFLSFFVVNIDRILPDRDFLLQVVSFPNEDEFVARLMAITAQSMYFINFDEENYPRAVPVNRYRAIEPRYPGRSVIMRAWLEFCNNQKSVLFDQLEQIWPWNRPLITRLGWEPNQLMDTRWIKVLLTPGAWFSRFTPSLRQQKDDQADSVVNPVHSPARNVEHLSDNEGHIDLHTLVEDNNALMDILKAISSDRKTAWEVLEEFLEHNPAILSDWFKRKRTRGQRYLDDFLPGTRANFKKLCQIAGRILPKFSLRDITR
jgi:hypothetical protein